MRKLVLASLVALLVPTASFAQFQLGARVGFAPAMGDGFKDSPMSDGIKSQIPLQLDALYKVMPDLAVGGYFSYGIGQIGDAGCDVSGVDCSASVMRFGVQGLYTFNQVKAPLVPWAGLGFGYEIAKGTAKFGGEKFEETDSGFEFVNLQVGGDYKVNEQFSVGPYLQFSVSQYSKVKATDSSAPEENFDGDVPSDAKALHQWFGFGVAGKFSL